MNSAHVLKLGSLTLAGLAAAALSIGASAQSAATATTTAAGTTVAATSAAAAATTATAPAPATTAAAQSAPSELEEIVVTGTSIRGVAPVGSNLITLDRQTIDQTGAQTIQQVLRDIPAITGSAATPQGGNPGNAFYAPTIHGIGSSSSNATLVLVDGHRISPGSQQQTLTDPNIIPPIMLERVEVLAEGASATYGSDAVAGVVNFITRKSYDGVLITAQGGEGDSYHTAEFGALWGTRWEGSSLMAGFNYSDRSSLAYSARSSLDRNHTAEGGGDFDTSSCSPAAITAGGKLYASPTATVVSPTSTICQDVPTGSILPHEIRENGMVKFTKSLTPNLDFALDVVVSSVTNNTPTARGTLAATVYGPGSTPAGGAGQINPFYVDPPGVAATSQTVRFDSDALLGPGGANSFNNNNDYYVAGNLEYKLPGDFRVTGFGLFGGEASYVGNTGQLCVSCAYLALNGTALSNGSTTTSGIPGTNTIVTNLPLTAANALDVWNPPGATNRTSAAVLASLTNNVTDSRWFYAIDQYKLGVDGSAFELPGGPVKVATGIEWVHYGLDIDKTSPNAEGTSTLESQTFLLNINRNVESAYGEVLVPIVGEKNAMPFVRKADLSLSGRWDEYIGLAETRNPHLGIDWESFPGVTLRANYSTSFVAPQLTSVGDVTRGGLTSFSGYSNTTLTGTAIPLANFPLVASVPGAVCGPVSCTLPNTVNGVTVNGGPANPKPGTGQSWSVGLQFAPTFVPHFSADITLFNTNLNNQISGNSVSNAINSKALNGDLLFYPAGATAAQIAAGTFNFPQLSAISSPTYFIVSVRQQNLLNLYTQGMDADFHYNLPTAAAGNFRVAGLVTYFTKFDQSIAGSPRFNVLNTTGFNNTFPSIQLQGRGNLGWDFVNLSADMFVNFVGAYHNWSSNSIIPLTHDANGNPNGGGDYVDATVTLDAHLAYNISGWHLNGSQVFLDVTNIANSTPAFYNGSTGYDNYAGNILGRVVTFGFRAKL